MIRLYVDSYVPKYENGKWAWNDAEETMDFHRRAVAVDKQYIKTNGFKFSTNMNQMEESIFRQEFQRPAISRDGDVIVTQDIKNLVLFLAPKEMMTMKFIKFVHTLTVDNFLHALLIYFEHFLKMVEFVVIRRDEISCEKAQLQSEESSDIKRIYSSYLTQYRLLVAREYSKIILGVGDVKPFYHVRPVIKLSKTISDKRLHEEFLAFSTQVVWIAMHRRAYNVIDAEMCRLFRSEHFILGRNDHIKFTTIEANMLYGINYSRVNYRAQTSPLIQELKNVVKENCPILWMGSRKYRGNDIRMHELELEFIVPDSQLCLIDIVHGILGHPKSIYDTMLNIQWNVVRRLRYNEDYDPYHIVRQPALAIPNINEELLRKHAQQYDSYYELLYVKDPISIARIKKWVQRQEVIDYFTATGFITDIWKKCLYEVSRKSYGASVDAILKKFAAQKKILLKKK